MDTGMAATTVPKNNAFQIARFAKRPLCSQHFSDYFIFILFLVIANVHLIRGGFDSSLIFLPEAVKAGQWWRIFTFPFVHITWYHLVLDAGAFFMLYKDIEHEKLVIRILYLALCGIASLCAALFASPVISSLGLCGLSGIAHGLMAVSALSMMKKRTHFRLGTALFLGVVCKSIYETIAGGVIFSFMHLGLCGTPLAACHAGGVLGGLIAFCLINKFSNSNSHQSGLARSKPVCSYDRL